MDEKRKDGYIAGLLFLIAFAIFLVSAINNGMNTSGLILWVITIIFGGLGFGSLWKPDSVGAFALQLLKYFSQSEEKSESHNKQAQDKTSGSVQVIASHGAKVNVRVASEKEEKAQNLPEKEKESHNEETIIPSNEETIVVSDGYYYEVKLKRGEHLKGKIASLIPISICFVDKFNFLKWCRDKPFKSENCNGDVLDINIDYIAPQKGTWYLLIDKKGKKPATVKVRLY